MSLPLKESEVRSRAEPTTEAARIIVTAAGDWAIGHLSRERVDRELVSDLRLLGIYVLAILTLSLLMVGHGWYLIIGVFLGIVLGVRLCGVYVWPRLQAGIELGLRVGRAAACRKAVVGAWCLGAVAVPALVLCAYGQFAPRVVGHNVTLGVGVAAIVLWLVVGVVDWFALLGVFGRIVWYKAFPLVLALVGSIATSARLASPVEPAHHSGGLIAYSLFPGVCVALYLVGLVASGMRSPRDDDDLGDVLALMKRELSPEQMNLLVAALFASDPEMDGAIRDFYRDMLATHDHDLERLLAKGWVQYGDAGYAPSRQFVRAFGWRLRRLIAD